MYQNRTVRLANRPQGQLSHDVFETSDEAVAEPGEGQILVKSEYVSLDPAMRGWLNEGKSYVPPVAIGEIMRGFAAGHVVASRNAKFKEGDAVSGLLGVQTHALSDGKGIVKVDTSLAPLPTWVGGLGMPGMTAYFGVRKILKPEAGETLVVDAASGAVGQIVGQIAKLEGARAVGIAGGVKKCAALTDEFGFDAAVDYKGGNLRAELKAAAPDGIDCAFENVGGEIFDAVLARMNLFGRIAVCGLISMYNATELPPGPRNMLAILAMRLTVRGFIVFDFIKDYPEASETLGGWYKDGKLKFREDIREEGIDAFARVLPLLFNGENFGKLILKL